jgi:hypothetical protein
MCYDGFIYHAELYSARTVVLFCLYMLVVYMDVKVSLSAYNIASLTD